MESDDIEVENEAQLLNFIAKMKENMKQDLKSLKSRIQPACYNKAAPADRTKSHRKQKIEASRKAFRAAGYHDISSFFEASGPVTSRSSSSSFESLPQAPGVMEEVFTVAEEEEEEEVIMRRRRIHLLREEEEEKEEEEIGGNIQSSSVAPLPGMQSSFSVSLSPPPPEEDTGPESLSNLNFASGSGSPPNSVIRTRVEDSGSNHCSQCCQPLSPDSTHFQTAITSLKKKMKEKDLSAILRARISAMLAFLHFYTTGEMGWKEASITASKGSGCGLGFAQSLRLWVWEYLEDSGSLPTSRYGTNKSKTDDEDFS
ncbi:hypothetical protein M422DRAFT_242362 [Sphaerobolus stellatus SS14]|nr:hypothetical protein M422DRAFT_242362 [Sphaerobolus stellatus SS14]